MEPTDITANLTTIGGIVIATIAIVNLLKYQLSDVPWLRKVPILVYVIAVSLALTFAANRILGTIQGDLYALCVQAFLQALMASGAVSWGKNPEAPKTAGADKPSGTNTALLLLMLIPLVALSGCATTPRGKLAQANIAIDALNKTYAEAVYAGWLTDDQIVKFGNAIGALSEAADLAQQMQDAGSLDGSILQQINDGIALVRRRLIEEIERNRKNERAIGTGGDWRSASGHRPGNAMGNHCEAAWGNLATAV